MSGFTPTPGAKADLPDERVLVHPGDDQFGPGTLPAVTIGTSPYTLNDLRCTCCGEIVIDDGFMCRFLSFANHINYPPIVVGHLCYDRAKTMRQVWSKNRNGYLDMPTLALLKGYGLVVTFSEDLGSSELLAMSVITDHYGLRAVAHQAGVLVFFPFDKRSS